MDKACISSTELAARSVLRPRININDPRLFKLTLTSVKIDVAYAAASPEVISARGICTGFWVVGPSVNFKTLAHEMTLQ